MKYEPLTESEMRENRLEYINYALDHEDEWILPEDKMNAGVYRVVCPHRLMVYGEYKVFIGKDTALTDELMDMAKKMYKDALVLTKDELERDLK